MNQQVHHKSKKQNQIKLQYLLAVHVIEQILQRIVKIIKFNQYHCQNMTTLSFISTYVQLALVFIYFAKLQIIIIVYQKNMAESSKFTSPEEKMVETSDDYYVPSKSQDLSKSAVNTLMVTLNSKKTKLRSLDIQQKAIHQKMDEQDIQLGRISIANQFLSRQADNLATKNAELYSQKSELVKQLKQWKQAKSCLSHQLEDGQSQISFKKKYLESLQQNGKDLREKIRSKEAQNQEIRDYNNDLDSEIQKNDVQVAKTKEQRDTLSKTATTLETFAKSFKKNISIRGKQVEQVKFETGELQSMIVNKEFQRANLEKEVEKSDWESKMYVHHNQQIEKNNLKLKEDLEKLLTHLESIKKNNKSLNSCIKDYSCTGIQAAKKILQLANK